MFSILRHSGCFRAVFLRLRQGRTRDKANLGTLHKPVCAIRYWGMQSHAHSKDLIEPRPEGSYRMLWHASMIVVQRVSTFRELVVLSTFECKVLKPSSVPLLPNIVYPVDNVMRRGVD